MAFLLASSAVGICRFYLNHFQFLPLGEQGDAADTGTHAAQADHIVGSGCHPLTERYRTAYAADQAEINDAYNELVAADAALALKAADYFLGYGRLSYINVIGVCDDLKIFVDNGYASVIDI